MYLAELGVAVRAEFTEGSHGGVVVQHPVWGKSTMTFFPLDVTGPRAYVYYPYPLIPISQVKVFCEGGRVIGVKLFDD